MATEPTPISTRQPPPSRVTSEKAAGRDVSLNIDQRMLLVMQAIGYIPKEGTGPESQGSYKFARVEHIKDKVREALIEYGVMVYASIEAHDVQVLSGVDRENRPRSTVQAVVSGTLTFVNVDKPEEVRVIRGAGMGNDTQDKALSKAMTSFDKFALLNAFQIPTGTDPDETGEDVPQEPTGRPQRRAEPRNDAEYADDDPRSSQPAQRADSNDPDGECPKHHRAWKPGRYGYYCSAKDDSTEKGYCVLKPTKEWAAAHER